MFTRRNPAATEESAPMVDAPEAPVDDMPRCLRPSTFGTRKEHNPGPLEPVLVSMGTSEYIQTNHRTRRPEVLEVELFVEKTDPMKRYFRVKGDNVIQPMFDNHSTTESVEWFEGELRRPDSSAFPPATVEEPARYLGFFPGGIGRPEASAFV